MNDTYETIVTAEVVEAAENASYTALIPLTVKGVALRRERTRIALIASGLPAEIARLRAQVERMQFAMHCASGDLMRLQELMQDKYMPNIKRDVDHCKSRIDEALAKERSRD